MDFNKSVKETKEPALPTPPKKRQSIGSLFDSITFKNQTLKESVLDPVNKNLCADVFQNEKMKPEVRKIIVDNFMAWWKEMEFKESQVVRIVVIGSSTGFQYSKTSDIDVNVQVNVDSKKLEEYWDLLPNGNNLPKTQHPINYFLVNDDSAVKSADSSYDATNDKWIKKPVRSDYKAPYGYALSVSQFFMYGIDLKISELDRDLEELKIYKDYLNDEGADIDDLNTRISMKELDIRADLDALGIAHHLARSFRQESFEDGYESPFLISIETKSPNESLNNVIYKILERFGYFNKIAKYDELWDKYETK